MPDATTTPTAEGATPEATETSLTDAEQLALGSDEGKKALEIERRARKEAEKASKAATAELEKLRQATATDQEKAVMAAKAEGRTEALREAGIGRVDDAVRAAAGGRSVDVDALLEGLDRTRFLDDDGAPDRDAIQAWIDRIVPAQETPGFPSLEQGTRTQAAQQLGTDDLTRTLTRMVGR